ncbi:unnamed protein product [Linum tenue]|uniref:Pentatricopeptide repeat-containing protein n=1 Tax=Linum tenue TaxID=586396 RepID=A0AAV0M9E4_9ROSI|nr:unnamed protein product [Linum tenue]
MRSLIGALVRRQTLGSSSVTARLQSSGRVGASFANCGYENHRFCSSASDCPRCSKNHFLRAFHHFPSGSPRPSTSELKSGSLPKFGGSGISSNLNLSPWSVLGTSFPRRGISTAGSSDAQIEFNGRHSVKSPKLPGDGNMERGAPPATSVTPQLVEVLTKILTTEKEPLQKLSSYIPHFSANSNLLVSLLSSNTLARMPTTLLSLLKWSQAHLPETLSRSPLPLLLVISSLVAHHKFVDAKTLMTSFIASDKLNSLHYHILHPDSRTRVTRGVYDLSIGAYVAAGRPHDAANIFRKMKRFGLKPNVLTCNTLLNGLVKYPSVHAVSLSKDVLEDVIGLGVKVNSNTFNIVIKGCCLESKFEEALELVDRMGQHGCSPDNVTYNTILDGMCKKGKLNEARDLLLDMKNRGLRPNVNTFNILISGYCKLGRLKEASQMIDLMTMSKVSADMWSYNMLIDGLCKVGRISEAFRLRDEIEKLEFSPDVVTYNTLIDGCFKFGSGEEAVRLVEEMEGKGLKPNSVTHNIRVKWFVKEGKMDEAANAVRKMEECGFSPDCITYNTLIDGYCKAGKMDEAFSVLHDMEKKQPKLDNVALNTILHTLSQDKKLDEAYDLLSIASRRGYFVDEVSYGTLISGYSKHEQLARALDLWDEMKEKKIIPSIITYNSMIAGLSRSGKTDQAIDLLNELLGNGLSPDEITYNTIIHGYCWEGQIEKAFRFHNQMVENSFKPDVFTCNILLYGLCTGGMLDKALKLFHTWISKGKQVDLVTYNTIISSLCRERRLEEATALYAEMKEKGLNPDRYTYNAILKAVTDAGKVGDIEDFILNEVEKGDSESQSIQMDGRQDEGTCTTCPETDESSIAYSEKISQLCAQGKYKDAVRHVHESRDNVLCWIIEFFIEAKKWNGDHRKKFASIFVSFTGKCYPGEADLAIARTGF